jgi:hypothetical protein
MRVGRLAVILAGALLAAGCSSTPKNTNVGRPSAAERGFRVLDAVVANREFEPVSGGGRSTAIGPGTYYLEFEASEGEAHVHYRFPVTRQQYQRYAEGDHVQLVLANDQLRELRPAPEPK